MKKLAVLFTILTVIFLVSCKSTKMNPSEFETIQGDTICLKGNPTTGYTWSYTESVKGLVSIEETVTYLGDDKVVGSPSLFKFKLKPVKDGNMLLIFMYKRNWEKDSPAESRMFLVNIKGSKVTITEE